MRLLDRWARRRGYVSAAELETRIAAARREGRVAGAMRRRAFNAAKVDATVESWLTDSASLNQDLYRDLRKIRARSRDLAQNQDYARAFLGRVRDNVVGHAGVQLQAKPLRPDGKVDTADAALIESAWWQWGRKGNCDVTGGLSWLELQGLIMQTVPRDGEILVRRVRGRKFGPHRYQLQLLDAALLDEEYNEDLRNGNRVRMSVEFDEWRRPVAYHLRADSSFDLWGTSYSSKRVRVPAEEILHLFVRVDVDQIRGVPWMHTAVLRLHQLGDFEEYAVNAAKTGAAKMGFFTSETDEDVEDVQQRIAQGGGDAGDGSEAPHEYYQEATPNHFDVLPRGIGFTPYDPQYPHQHYEMFVKACLRGIASGLRLNYNAWANDYESVNYSSLRGGLLDEREIWKGLQAWLIESLHDVIFSEWLEAAIMSGALPLPMSKFDKFDAATWRPRRWPWVDPLKDAQASKEEVALGINSRRRIIAERGDDPAEIWAELAEESKLLEGILPKAAPAAAVPVPAGGNNDDASDNDGADG